MSPRIPGLSPKPESPAETKHPIKLTRGRGFAEVLEERSAKASPARSAIARALAAAAPKTAQEEATAAIEQELLSSMRANLAAMSGRAPKTARLDQGKNDMDGDNICESPGGDGF